MGTITPGVLGEPGLSLFEQSVSALPDAMEATRKTRETQLETARRALAHALAAPDILRQMWNLLIADPSPERVDDLHANRERVRDAFDKWVRLVELAIRIMPKAADLAGRPLDGAEQLGEALDAARRFAASILSGWETREDLEEIIAETFPLPDWLQHGPVPAHLRPPQSWYDETTDPFVPE